MSLHFLKKKAIPISLLKSSLNGSCLLFQPPFLWGNLLATHPSLPASKPPRLCPHCGLCLKCLPSLHLLKISPLLKLQPRGLPFPSDHQLGTTLRTSITSHPPCPLSTQHRASTEEMLCVCLLSTAWGMKPSTQVLSWQRGDRSDCFSTPRILLAGRRWKRRIHVTPCSSALLISPLSRRWKKKILPW